VQCVEWPLKYPEAYSAVGLRLPRGMLLHGPPGCAKTSLVRAAASSCHVNFLAISGAQLYSPYLGDAEKKIAEVYADVISLFLLYQLNLILLRLREIVNIKIVKVIVITIIHQDDLTLGTQKCPNCFAYMNLGSLLLINNSYCHLPYFKLC